MKIGVIQLNSSLNIDDNATLVAELIEEAGLDEGHGGCFDACFAL